MARPMLKPSDMIMKGAGKDAVKGIGGTSPPPASEQREALQVEVVSELEECLEFKWSCIAGRDRLADSTVEMVIDREQRLPGAKGPFRPPKDAMVKRVGMGKDLTANLQNMPVGRNFLVAVSGKLFSGEIVRSPWIRAATLHPKDRDKDLGNLDPMSMPRLDCKACPCPGYIPQRFSLNSADKMKCRRCGCEYSDHKLVEVSEVLRQRQARCEAKLNGKKVVPLPPEALEWDERECNLWFHSDGIFHPRGDTHAEQGKSSGSRSLAASRSQPSAGKPGRVSICTPTTDQRQKFHRTLWECFCAQDWPDKELVVVETYTTQPSEFFTRIAESGDKRLVYKSYKREPDQDWSIGTKRNMCAHLSTGEFIANFDDDDLYAPSYLRTMVSQIQGSSAHAVTLSSWYSYDVRTSKWMFCDAIAWGWRHGLDGNAQQVRSWAFGYGFSYVHRRQDLMDVPYENINMGEDFNFISKLLIEKGEKSVLLFHDEFGICLHVQHGANTSNSFPIREVSHAESADLDIADLPAQVTRSFYSSGGKDPPTGKGKRTLKAHTFQGEFSVVITAGATIADFLEHLECSLDVEDGPKKVFLVPVETLHREEKQGKDQWVADILGFDINGPYIKEVSEANSKKVVDHKLRIIAEARRARRESDRIGLRVKNLWVLPAIMVPEEAIELGEDEEMIEVELAVQKTDVKSFFATGKSVRARIPIGATVGHLRIVLGRDLPPQGKVLVEKPGGRGVVSLNDDDSLPERVTITDFKGNKPFYMLFTKKQCRGALSMMKQYFEKAEAQEKLDEIERVTLGNIAEYRGKLTCLLMEDVYPMILKHYGLPEGPQGSRCFVFAMSPVTGYMDLELLKLWNKVETLMRNSVNVADSAHWIKYVEEGKHLLPEHAAVSAQWVKFVDPKPRQQAS